MPPSRFHAATICLRMRHFSLAASDPKPSIHAERASADTVTVPGSQIAAGTEKTAHLSWIRDEGPGQI
jgi:hypothetical protein